MIECESAVGVCRCEWGCRIPQPKVVFSTRGGDGDGECDELRSSRQIGWSIRWTCKCGVGSDKSKAGDKWSTLGGE